MTPKKQFETILGRAFSRIGFKRIGKIYCYDGSDAFLLCSFQKWDDGNEMFVNCGISIKALEPNPAKKVEISHIFARLKSLFPSSRDLILTAGALKASDPGAAIANLASHIGTDTPADKGIIPELKQIEADIRSELSKIE